MLLSHANLLICVFPMTFCALQRGISDASCVRAHVVFSRSDGRSAKRSDLIQRRIGSVSGRGLCSNQSFVVKACAVTKCSGEVVIRR